MGEAESMYVCPRSGASLVLRGDSLETEDGSHRYPLHHGVPRFLQYEPVEDEEGCGVLRRLNDLASREGWRQALAAVHGEESKLFRYVTDPMRQKFLDLLGLTDRDVVLELGPGLGQFTVPVAQRVAMVYGLEVVPGQAEFTMTRCQQEGVGNVRIACGGDDCRFPYREGSFDLVIINLVLEWCSSRNQGGSALDGQRRVLREAYRVLRAGGRLYLQTKNRYALRYLIGKRDEHAWRTPFGNALPRWLLHAILRLRGKDRPAGLLHSHNGLRRLLEEAGFDRPRSFWAAPEMRFPTDFIPTDGVSVREARRQKGFSQGDIRSVRLLMPFVPAGGVKHVTPGLLFLAQKRGTPA